MTLLGIHFCQEVLDDGQGLSKRMAPQEGGERLLPAVVGLEAMAQAFHALEMACRVLCGCSVEEAAAVTESTLDDLPVDGDVPAYEVWRRRIMSSLHPLQE